MSVFGKIKDAIFGRHANASEMPAANTPPAAGPAAPTPPSPGTSFPPQTGAASPAPSSAPAGSPAASTPPSSAPSAPASAPAAASASVDVEAVMDKAVKDSGQTLDWRRSIVDMMKALGLDSALADRKELAQELNYTGDTNDSATMNVWLHKALMKKLAENGGKVPAELTD